VYDNTLDQHFKEHHIFNLASQPRSPWSFLNNLMESTGQFREGNTFSAIVLFDSDTTSDMFKRDELDLHSHLCSISDEIVSFGLTSSNLLLKRRMPQLDLRHKTTPNVFVQSSLFQTVFKSLKHILALYTLQFQEVVAKKELKMHVDPWENYLVHDSKYFLPLLAHSSPLPIEEQIVLAFFVSKFVRSEQISEFKQKGEELVRALVAFVGEFGVDVDAQDQDLSDLEEEHTEN